MPPTLFTVFYFICNFFCQQNAYNYKRIIIKSIRWLWYGTFGKVFLHTVSLTYFKLKCSIWGSCQVIGRNFYSTLKQILCHSWGFTDYFKITVVRDMQFMLSETFESLGQVNFSNAISLLYSLTVRIHHLFHEKHHAQHNRECKDDNVRALWYETFCLIAQN